MNSRTRLLLFSLALLLPASCSTGPSTQTYESALQVVLDQVVQPDTLDRPVLVFGLAEPLQPGDQIGPFYKEGYGSPVEPTSIEEETWFFWIDDAPGARFAHPSRFVLVPRAGGQPAVTEREWWPVLNGQGLWIERDEYWDEGNWAFSNLTWGPPSASGPSSGKTVAAPVFAGDRQTGSPGAALVINGWEAGEPGQEDFEVDGNGMHDVLTDAGFEVTYLGPEEDANPDRDGQATGDRRIDWLNQKSDELEAGDTLVIFVTGHGGVTDGIGGIDGVWEDLLIPDLKKFDPGVHIIVILDSCHAGSFVDGLRQVADVTVVATSEQDSSYGDIDPSEDPNPDDAGGEFTSGFVEDWKQIMADPLQRASVEARAAQQGTNFWEELTAVSHVSATEKDAAALAGESFPSLARGVPETRPTPMPTQVVLQDGHNDGLNCVTGQPLSETPAGVDISRAIVDILLDESSGEPQDVQFTIELDRAPAIEGRLFGGVEFADGSTPTSPLNPDWYFDGIGNKNFSFGIQNAIPYPELHEYRPTSGWTSNPNTGFWVEVLGNRIFIRIPVEEIPANSPFYVSLTDFNACDAVGVSEDRTPSGRLPVPIDPLASTPTPASP